jgi:hypothetical protein
MGTLWLVLTGAAVLGAAVYGISLRIHPWAPCRSCKGSGKTRDRIWKPATGTCPRCRGGRRPRLGVRILAPARAKAMTPPKGTHKSIDQRRG